MEREARSIINKLSANLLNDIFDAILPFKVYRSEYKGTEVNIIVSGKDSRTKVDNVATQPATLMAYLIAKELKPDIVINAGTAGGFKSRGADIGTVYINTTIVFHDRRIPIPGFDEYGIGNYPAVQTKKLISETGLKPGVISTGNSLDICPKDQKMLIKNKADAKDMEAAAIAWVCSIYAIPFIAIKSITDLIDSEKTTQAEFLTNLEYASNMLCEKVMKTIDFLIQNGLQ